MLQLTYADVAVVSLLDEADNIFGIRVDLTKYAKLRELKGKVEANEGLADWLAKRPEQPDKPYLRSILRATNARRAAAAAAAAAAGSSL